MSWDYLQNLFLELRNKTVVVAPLAKVINDEFVLVNEDSVSTLVRKAWLVANQKPCSITIRGNPTLGLEELHIHVAYIVTMTDKNGTVVPLSGDIEWASLVTEQHIGIKPHLLEGPVKVMILLGLTNPEETGHVEILDVTCDGV